MEKCGQCRQFIRTKKKAKDMCGAWEQPTRAGRDACDFYMNKKEGEKTVEDIS